MDWNEQFLELFDRCVSRYQAGDRDFTGYYSEADLAFLKSIGYKPRELFDFVEDLVDEGSPARSTALLVASVRRDYLLVAQGGSLSSHEITMRDLPSFGDELEGIAYLPRIITKARAKLKGELDPDIMFGCGGDRNFLRKHGDIHPADFLRHVWAAGDDDAKIAAYVRDHS
ncbi:DUF5069 domain-containing protein [Roseibacillus ishigakijimensis]|uniref:DUF5069 domain-containing protein n=1 Tax=Roseibacillus ishigakijimensis TaxID=454146 RepID=A0A934RTR1_9BACT|nr:DUF5069 domain-containing protein [Roseibacillus ishigakijimensis]MBK1835273.1 DUF5069 domain-containing protein [Roseibacillus ishigakijimensis]